MMAIAPPPSGVTYENGTYTYYDWNATSAGTTVFPIYYPVMPQSYGHPPSIPEPKPEPVDDSALAWLRKEIDEICDLAFAA